ncbi:Solute carrier family 66 member 2 [Fragariocoptes setiger]|uniref:Solute carrier family 66 member 2 n=1 Tax=Fragariocoptes setiger TaxID=1670756 RepID=A0ABQ7SCX0_9ACAR|nr:Solute carrier family 66 member 2 [Fragariocoptes setiger]
MTIKISNDMTASGHYIERLQTATATLPAQVPLQLTLLGVSMSNNIPEEPNDGNSTSATNITTYTKDVVDWISDFPWPSAAVLTALLGNLSSVAMIVGGLLPYVPQYIQIHRSKDSSGTECRYFWRWTSFTSYLEFLCIFSIILAFVVYLSVTQLENPHVVETIGYASTIIESMLGLPQFITNFRKKSTFGMSVSMVMMWLSGDLFKTVYFVVKDTPKQFWLCGFTQVTIDLLIMLQICLYRGHIPVSIEIEHPDLEVSPKASLT